MVAFVPLAATAPDIVSGTPSASANAPPDALDAPSWPTWLPALARVTVAPLAVSVGTITLLPPGWVMAPPLTRSTSVNPLPPPTEVMFSVAPGEPRVSVPAVEDPS